MRDVDPATWGGDGWRFLHAIGSAYPTEPDRETRRAMHQLVESLQVLLPCGQCRRHLREFARESGMRTPDSAPLRSRDALRAWLDAAHKNANSHRDARLGAKGDAGRASGAAAVAAGPVVAPAAPRPTFAKTVGLGRSDRSSPETKRGLVVAFAVLAIALLGLFIALIAVTCRRSRVRSL
jgi:bacterioferritin-associated ferredoxin